MFLWGSRRFPFEVMPESIHRLVENWRRSKKKSALEPTEVELYEVAAQYHEHLAAKYCTLLGTTLAGVVSFEDRVAARICIPVRMSAARSDAWASLAADVARLYFRRRAMK